LRKWISSGLSTSFAVRLVVGRSRGWGAGCRVWGVGYQPLGREQTGRKSPVFFAPGRWLIWHLEGPDLIAQETPEMRCRSKGLWVCDAGPEKNESRVKETGGPSATTMPRASALPFTIRLWTRPGK
jgi:hypothetical protein